MGMTREERERLGKLERNNKKLQEHVQSLTSTLKLVVGELKSSIKTNNDMRTQINLSNYTKDDLGQYGRKESYRNLDVDESVDAEKGAIERANFILSQIDERDEQFKDLKDYKVVPSDIQRCHRIGDKEKARSRGKKRPIIVKLKDYRLRMAILLNKKKLQKNRSYKEKGEFIAEDLTPFKNKLLWYSKQIMNADGKKMFYHLHTRDGKIKGKLTGGSDQQEWITINSPEDFHKHGHDVDIDLLNKEFHQFKILKQVQFNFQQVENSINAICNYEYE